MGQEQVLGELLGEGRAGPWRERRDEGRFAIHGRARGPIGSMPVMEEEAAGPPMGGRRLLADRAAGFLEAGRRAPPIPPPRFGGAPRPVEADDLGSTGGRLGISSDWIGGRCEPTQKQHGRIAAITSHKRRDPRPQ